jgi:HTH-type transcriptional regulator / antitoxin HigA
MSRWIKQKFAMDIKPIRTEADYKASLKEISALMESDPEPGTADGDRLDILATLVEAYENRHFPMDFPDPVEAILFRMERQGLKPKDLEPMIGQRNRVYEILNRKRPLTMAMVWRLHKGLGIPAESLIRKP